MFDFNLDGILAGAQWAAATTQLFYGHVEAVVFFYATSLLSYYEKLLPMRRPDVLFFCSNNNLVLCGLQQPTIMNLHIWETKLFLLTFCTKISLHGLPSIINLTHGTFVFRGSEKGALVIYVVGIHGKNH